MKINLLVGSVLTCCLVAIAIVGVPNLGKKLAPNKMDRVVGILTFTCREFSTSRDFLCELPHTFSGEKPNGPTKGVNEKNCVATVRAFYTFTDAERIFNANLKQSQMPDDLIIGQMLLRDTHHWGLIREYGVYQDENGHFIGEYLQHRLSETDKHRMASEALDAVLANWLPNDAFNQRATLIDEGILPPQNGEVR